MKIIEKDNYKILKDEKNDIAGFANYMSQNHSIFKEDNVIVDVLKKGDLELEELLMFLEISNIHRAEKKSFVIVNDAINIDQVPEELIVVPTLLEATDIIKMEELERELGF
ncbi:hypothetical protein SAMN04487764_2716 [Gillisia sp. Hel1_33_143]|uniref:ribonuclease Z n=1 Tax=Gillisia sp. Hel1_33_143 TaxID=1336796 RepID=UPI00087DC3F5|nr:ribonuclease Z [Gillisia sp. Hel1_33_143]SDS65072.1 hypothetical protein SAMN04487764_2716 [Gillisia sp. Hel1_33_143]